jgi:serpin B
MAYAGSAGSTAEQFQSVLRVGPDPASYFARLDWVSLELAGRAERALSARTRAMQGMPGAVAPSPDDFRLDVVSSLWAQRTFTFGKPFLDTLATNFGAGVYLADFMGQPDAERRRVNMWVSEQTQNRINDLLAPQDVDALTRAILVNALRLKLPWALPFPPSATRTGAFTREDASTVEVPFMHQNEPVPYAEDATAQAVAVPLAGGELQLVLFVPKQGTSLAEMEPLSSRAQALTTALGSSGFAYLTLPRFRFTIDSLSIANPLKALGLTLPFDPWAADFSAMTRDAPVFLQDVAHKAMIGVNELGIEAAGATGVLVVERAGHRIVADVVLDRPFLFGIYDAPTSTWLFLGHVTDPSSPEAG